jgi:ribosomal RNA-processing protein 8
MMNNFLSKKTYRDNNFNQNKSKKGKKNIADKIKEGLLGSKFRILNEKLYTISSEDAYEYFKNNPEDFEIYHQGFVIQASKWPVNPNDIIFDELKKPKYENKIIADLGCGEAYLAQKLSKTNRKIHSFDLVKINEYITQCDIKNVPLKNEEVDVAVFCLSLMGTNFVDFIKEAKRILKNKGILIVSEIESRIVNKDNFIKVFESVGFSLRKKMNIKNYFTLFVFRLDKEVDSNSVTIENSYDILKPCIYKKR